MANLLFGTLKPLTPDPKISLEEQERLEKIKQQRDWISQGGKIIKTFSGTEWIMNGHRHRDNGPAVELITGDLFWYQNGLIHRDHDLPAAVYGNGREDWFQNGALHRDSDKPAIEAKSFKAWYKQGNLHRTNGPAIEDSMRKEWYQEGVRHRIGEPAVVWSNGAKEWWENGVLIESRRHDA